MTRRRPPFRDWLRRHRHDNTPLGDLARAVLEDRCWPVDGDHLDYRLRLLRRGANQTTMATFNTAWSRYTAADRP